MTSDLDLVIRRARVATASDQFDCDIGIAGGRIVAQATPEGVVQRGTHTGVALAAVLAPKSARRLADDAVCAD